jgi:hypothetical protein
MRNLLNDIKVVAVALAVAVGPMLSAAPAQARLGYTIQECKEKYGKVIKTDVSKAQTAQYVFKSGKFVICASPIDGIVQNMTYAFKGKDVADKAMDILQKNVPGEWSLYDDGRGKETLKTWRTLDKMAT